VSIVYESFFIRIRKYFILFLLVFNIPAFSQVSLQSGWNLVGNASSAPVLPSSIGSGTQVTSVWKWDAKNSKWSFYSPQKSDGGQAYSASQGYEFLTSINPNDGFWVNAAQPYLLSLNTGGISVSTFNALAGLGSTAQTTSTPLSSLLSEAVLVHTGVLTASVSGVSGLVPFLQSALSYLKADGSVYSVCVNTPWIDANHSSNTGNNCGSKSGINLTGTWSASSGSTNSIKITQTSDPTFLNTVRFTDINATQGILFQSEPNTYGNVLGFAGSSAYLMLSNTFTLKNLAGVSSLITGQADCINGLANVVFSSDGTSGSRTCQIAKVDGSANTASTVTYANSSIPGVLTITDNNGKINYFGITSGSNSSSGQTVTIIPGTTQCGTGTGFSLNNCGTIILRTYSN